LVLAALIFVLAVAFFAAVRSVRHLVPLFARATGPHFFRRCGFSRPPSQLNARRRPPNLGRRADRFAIKRPTTKALPQMNECAETGHGSAC
ncbi:MAG: hypothetical protein ACI95R_002747, partial [Halioglobus sp.]